MATGSSLLFLFLFLFLFVLYCFLNDLPLCSWISPTPPRGGWEFPHAKLLPRKYEIWKELTKVKETRININVVGKKETVENFWPKGCKGVSFLGQQRFSGQRSGVRGVAKEGAFAWCIQHLFDVMFWYFLTPTRDADRRATNVPQWKRNELITCISKQKLVRYINQLAATENPETKTPAQNEADYLNEMILWIEKWPPGMRDNIKRLPKPCRTEPHST